MIVMKFGGRSIQDAAAINAVIEIVAARADRKPIVVVSAMARVTDALLDVAQAARDRRFDEASVATSRLRDRHLATARELLGESSESSLEIIEREIQAQFAELE